MAGFLATITLVGISLVMYESEIVKRIFINRSYFSTVRSMNGLIPNFSL